MRTSCIYSRGITPAFNFDGSADNSRFSSMVWDGHGSGYVCGFGHTFMNGRFQQGFQVAPNGGWFGDWSNKDVNTMGLARHLLTHMRFVTRAYRGQNWLVISDVGSLTDMTGGNSWAQFIKWLGQQDISCLPHTAQEIQNGAYGYDTRPEFFLQFSGVLLLLSGNIALNNQLSRAITDSITLGASVVILQKSATEGWAPVNNILSPLGIEQAGSAYIKTPDWAVQHSINVFQQHVAWTKIKTLHLQFTEGLSATYRVLASGKGTIDSVAGQPGKWEAFNCIEVSDETDIREPIFYMGECCRAEGDAYEATFNAPAFPEKPDNWWWAINRNYLKIDWTSDNAQDLWTRSLVRFRCTGKNGGQAWIALRDGALTNVGPGFTVVVLNALLQTKDVRQFNTVQGGQGSAQGLAQAQAMANYLNGIANGDHVVVMSSENAWPNRTANGLPAAMYRCGASRSVFEASWFKSGSGYLMFGTKGIVEGNATIEMYYMPKPVNGQQQPVAFYTGFNITDENIPYCCGTDEKSRNTIDIQELYTNGLSARLRYFKQLSGVDSSKNYGIKHTTSMYDTRFKKINMRDTKNTVVSVENPCVPQDQYEPWDWVRVWNAPGYNNTDNLNYMFKDSHEYMVILKERPNGNIVTHRFIMDDQTYNMMNSTMLDCGDQFNWLVMNGNGAARHMTTNNKKAGFLQLYERPVVVQPRGTAINPQSNDWELFAPYDSGRYVIGLEPGYEYTVFIEDRHGEWEFAQKRIVLLPEAYRASWEGYRYVGYTNSCAMRVDNAYAFYCSFEGNRVAKVLRRPLFWATDSEDKGGWQIAYHDKSAKQPQTPNVGLRMERDCEYIVMVAQRYDFAAVSCSPIFTWDKVYELRDGRNWTDNIEGYDTGAVGWSYDGNRLLTRQGVKSYDSYWGNDVAPYGVFLVLKRKVRAWEPSEIERMRNG